MLPVNVDKPTAAMFVSFIFPHGTNAFLEKGVVRTLAKLARWDYVIIQAVKQTKNFHIYINGDYYVSLSRVAPLLEG